MKFNFNRSNVSRKINLISQSAIRTIHRTTFSWTKFMTSFNPNCKRGYLLKVTKYVKKI